LVDTPGYAPDAARLESASLGASRRASAQALRADFQSARLISSFVMPWRSMGPAGQLRAVVLHVAEVTFVVDTLPFCWYNNPQKTCNHSVLTEVTLLGPQAFGRPSPTGSLRRAHKGCRRSARRGRLQWRNSYEDFTAKTHRRDAGSAELYI